MCDREWEVIESLRNGHTDAELRSHAAECADCNDLTEVAGALLDDRRTLMREAPIPGSGLVWWRTTMRARQEAAHRAMIAARVVQAALVTIALIAAIVWIGPKSTPIDLHAIFTAMSGFALPLFAVAGLLILAPVAVYFVVTEE